MVDEVVFESGEYYDADLVDGMVEVYKKVVSEHRWYDLVHVVFASNDKFYRYAVCKGKGDDFDGHWEYTGESKKTDDGYLIMVSEVELYDVVETRFKDRY